MRYRLLAAALIATGGVTALIFSGRPTAAAENDEAAIRDAIAAYVKAFNSADADGILAVWSADAEYIDEAGKSTKGREKLAALFGQCLQDNKNCKIEITTKAIRVLKDGVALQDGVSTLTRSTGETDSNPLSAVWVKKDGKWRLELVRNLAASTSVPSVAPSGLADLGWLVGEWTAVERDAKATLTCRWIKGQKFLALDYSVGVEGQEAHAVMHIVGLDPTNGQIRSWAFEAHGGFGEGLWDRQPNKWTVELAGVTADGKAGAATMIWSVVDGNAITFQILNREIAGQALPDVKLTFHRTGPTK